MPLQPTCVDDDADDSLCVSDGAPSQQHVLLVQPHLLPVLVLAVGGQVARVTHSDAYMHLASHSAGDGRPGRGLGDPRVCG